MNWLIRTFKLNHAVKQSTPFKAIGRNIVILTLMQWVLRKNGIAVMTVGILDIFSVMPIMPKVSLK